MVMSHYLVTGGFGFIGSNLVEELVKDGHKVSTVDDFSTGSIENLSAPGGGKIVPNVFLGTSIKMVCKIPAFSKVRYDGIFHLGQPSSTPMYRNNRKLVSKTIDEFISVMEYAREYKCPVVYASSSSVYNGNPVPWHESAPLLATDFYSEVRVSFERLARVYYELHGVCTCGLRLFSVYGPRETYKQFYANLITQLIWAKRNNIRFEVFGDGKQTRDVTYVSDVVDAFVLAMEKKIPGAPVFNVGTGKSYSINKIAKKIGTEIYYAPVPFLNYVENTLANPMLAEKYLGFKAKVSLDEGLSKLLASK
jgi:UDP-glucose 4-epimerase